MKILYTDEMDCGLTYDFFTKIAESVFNELDMQDNQYEISLLLTDDEISELRSTVKVKLDEILAKREDSERENEKKHDIVMFAIPSQEN